LDETKKIGDYDRRIFQQNSINEPQKYAAENIEIIPREMSLVDLVFKTFSNWGKS
jgi:hypothetical protein